MIVNGLNKVSLETIVKLGHSIMLNNNSNITSIIKKTGLTNAHVYLLINELVNKGLITKKKNGRDTIITILDEDFFEILDDLYYYII